METLVNKSTKPWLRGAAFIAALFALALVLPVVAASKDPYEGRVAAMQAFRLDFGWAGVVISKERIVELYKDACKNKSTNACKYESWIGATGGDIAKAVQTIGSRCPSEPQSCVVVGFYYSRDAKGNLNPTDAGKALNAFSQSCGKTYAPGCTHLGEMHLYGVGTPANADKARDLFEEACDAGEPYGCYLLGTLYASGRGGLTADPAKARSLYEAACADQIPHACVELGTLYVNGKSGPPDPKKALSYFEPACKDGFAAACAQIGRMYEKGVGMPLDPKKAEELYESACSVGDLTGCLGIAMRCEDGQREGCDAEDAVKVYEEACTSGRSDACSRLGRMYIKGQWVDKNVGKGTALLEQACKGGEADACDGMGEYYEKGIEKPDLVKASNYYQQACKGGSGKGCYHLGKMYQANRGPGADPAKANDLFVKACDYGHGKSCLMLADIYLTGAPGIPKDVKKAQALYEQGCTGGDGDACYKVGESWLRGDSGTSDPTKAADYFQRACANDGYLGCFQLGQMYEKGTGVTMDILRAAKLYSRACAKGVDAACNVSTDIQFKAWFITDIQTAFEDDLCEIFGYDEERPEETRQIARAKKGSFDVLAGTRKGTGLTATPGDSRFISGDTYRGYSPWTLATSKGSLAFEHYVLWNTEEPLDSLDGAEVFSTDRKGKSTLVFAMEDEETGYVNRQIENPKEQKCTFVNGYPSLSVTHCSSIQALIAAQLLSECKGE